VTVKEPDDAADPVFLPFDPKRGWAQANLTFRILALSAPAMILAWAGTLAYRWPQDDADFAPSAIVLMGALTAAAVFLGPFAAYAAARVLRPHVRQDNAERQARHALAAVATAYGLAMLTMLANNFERGLPLTSFGGFYLYLLCAPTLGPLTVVWGVIAAASRLRRRGTRLHSPAATAA